TKAHYALELVAVLLTYGDSSVLHQSLVREQGELQGIGAWTYDHRGPDLLVLQSILSAKGNLTKVRSAIDSQLAQIAQEGPKEADLAKAKQQMQSMFLF